MTSDRDELLGALGALQRNERAELAQLEAAADELAALEPERAQVLEDRLMDELFTAPAVQKRKGRVVRLFPAAAVSCAMAAAAMLWVARPSSPAFDVGYTLVPPAPDARERSSAAAEEPGQYSLGRTLTFTLRPSDRYTGQLRVLCYAAQGDELVQLAPQVQVEPEGGARVVLPQLREGSWELLFYVSPLTAAAVSKPELLARACPEDTRCLSFKGRFVQADAL